MMLIMILSITSLGRPTHLFSHMLCTIAELSYVLPAKKEKKKELSYALALLTGYQSYVSDIENNTSDW